MCSQPSATVGVRHEPLTRYLVELAPTSVSLTGIQALAERVRQAAATAAIDGPCVRFLRVVFVPEDGSCLLLYEGESELVVRQALTAAGLAEGHVIARVSAGNPDR